MMERPDISSQSRDVRVQEIGASLADVYDQLRALARALMASERPGLTLQATSLTHEAVIRLSRRDDIPPDDHAKWVTAAADEMRRVLIDSARRRGALKRRPPGQRVGLDGLGSCVRHAEHPEEILALDSAFLRLIDVHGRAADVVRLRFYLGLGVDETAESLGISKRTVLRDWEFARAFLANEILRT